MTLPELAALAAEKVPGFVRPASYCRACGNQGGKCNCDEGYGIEWDNSPAALLMAVVMFAHETHIPPYTVVIGMGPKRGVGGGNIGNEHGEPRTQEGIARAALVALLRAHGVQVSDER